jgi:NADH dehydrogenase
MATISRFRAIATLGPVRFSGFIGWLAWLLVHLAFLTGFKNRVAAIASWTIAFIGGGRPERAITVHQALGPGLVEPGSDQGCPSAEAAGPSDGLTAR